MLIKGDGFLAKAVTSIGCFDLNITQPPYKDLSTYDVYLNHNCQTVKSAAFAETEITNQQLKLRAKQ